MKAQLISNDATCEVDSDAAVSLDADERSNGRFGAINSEGEDDNEEDDVDASLSILSDDRKL